MGFHTRGKIEAMSDVNMVCNNKNARIHFDDRNMAKRFSADI